MLNCSHWLCNIITSCQYQSTGNCIFSRKLLLKSTVSCRTFVAKCIFKTLVSARMVTALWKPDSLVFNLPDYYFFKKNFKPSFLVKESIKSSETRSQHLISDIPQHGINTLTDLSMNCLRNISFLLGSPMQKFPPVANWKSSSCHPPPRPPKKGFDHRDVVRIPPHTAGSLGITLKVVVGKGVVGSCERACCSSAAFPDQEEKDSEQAAGLRGGLKSPGNMENGCIQGAREAGTKFLSCMETDNSCMNTQITGDLFLTD